MTRPLRDLFFIVASLFTLVALICYIRAAIEPSYEPPVTFNEYGGGDEPTI